VTPPGQPVPDDEGEAEANDQLREEALEVEDVAHVRAR
jgi:hypothetical protein